MNLSLFSLKRPTKYQGNIRLWWSAPELITLGNQRHNREHGFQKIGIQKHEFIQLMFHLFAKLFQVVYVHETYKNVGSWLRLREKLFKLCLVSLGGESSLKALQVKEWIMRLHQRQILHGA